MIEPLLKQETSLENFLIAVHWYCQLHEDYFPSLIDIELNVKYRVGVHELKFILLENIDY